MKKYFKVNELPSLTDIGARVAELLVILEFLKKIGISLSIDERVNSRKMGPRRLAYARAAAIKGKQFERVLPRTFLAADFDAIMAFRAKLEELSSLGKELSELLDDTTMAAGIDAMTYTKLVHDGLKAVNYSDPAYDDVLAELNEFNRQVRQQDEEEDAMDDTTTTES